MAASTAILYDPFDPSSPGYIPPLVATIVNGQTVIAHAGARIGTNAETGAPIYALNPNESASALPFLGGLLEGQLFGVDKKLIAITVVALLLLKK